MASPVSAFDQHPDLLKQYQAAYPDATPSLGSLVGVGHERDHEAGARLGLQDGDLTRQGVLEAFKRR